MVCLLEIGGAEPSKTPGWKEELKHFSQTVLRKSKLARLEKLRAVLEALHSVSIRLPPLQENLKTALLRANSNKYISSLNSSYTRTIFPPACLLIINLM